MSPDIFKPFRQRWSPEQKEFFNKTWEYLKGVEHQINQLCTNFNKENGRGLCAIFKMAEYEWGALFGYRPARPDAAGKEPERLLEKYDINNSLRNLFPFHDPLAVYKLKDEEAIMIGELVAEIGKIPKLHVMMVESKGSELIVLQYSIKPDFKKFS